MNSTLKRLEWLKGPVSFRGWLRISDRHIGADDISAKENTISQVKKFLHMPAKMALLIIDMLNDFVYGALASPTNKGIIPNIKKILIQARKSKIPVIYICDSHYPDVDWELRLWGPHAIAGTKGAEIIDELRPEEGEFIIKKRRYSGFFQTDLGILLRELGVDTLLLTGLDTSICVSHTAADAFFRGYSLIVPKDAVNTFDPSDNERALMYLKRIYGAEITNTEELISRLRSL